jgi:hypothetical protein
MSAFATGVISHLAQEQNDAMNFTRTENGHAAVSDTGMNDDLLVLFDSLIRTTPFHSTLSTPLKQILEKSWETDDHDAIADVFVLAFQTRWCRGGKGERSHFYSIMTVLLEFYPSIVIKLLPLIPTYGYWKDPLLLLRRVKEGGNLSTEPSSSKVYADLEDSIWRLFASQLDADLAELSQAALEDRAPKISLCAKFAPSEKKEFDKAFGCALKIAKLLHPSIKGDKPLKKLYRLGLKKLRLALGIPEVFECANLFGEIDFGKVSSLALSRKMRAYLNEVLKGEGNKSSTAEDDDDDEWGRGNRHPDNEDRVQCRKNLIKKIIDGGGVKGKDLFPHELVEKVKKGTQTSSIAVNLVIDSQWKAIREGVVKMVEDKKKALLQEVKTEDLNAMPIDVKKNLDLGKVICMADVSGSMTGTPMSVSIAMGILLSEVCHPSFRDLVLTFEDNPIFHNLKSCGSSFVKKVRSLQRAPWGVSTDFGKAMKLIAEIVETNKLKQEDIPDLLVVSDMQFDQAEHRFDSGSRKRVASEQVKKLFADLGVKLFGAPLEPPGIIFWNVRSSEGFPAGSEAEGVVLLSGYSPSLMTFVLSGEFADEVEIKVDEVTGEVTKKVMKITPKAALRKVLNDDGLEAVRQKVLEALSGGDNVDVDDGFVEVGEGVEAMRKDCSESGIKWADIETGLNMKQKAMDAGKNKKGKSGENNDDSEDDMFE